jgi:hypothetical protein
MELGERPFPIRFMLVITLLSNVRMTTERYFGCYFVINQSTL